MTLVIGEYAMPDPDDLGGTAYRAIHQALQDRLHTAKGQDKVALALDQLDDFRAWAEHLMKKLEAVHRVP